jgi:hypothetical protein
MFLASCPALLHFKVVCTATEALKDCEKANRYPPQDDEVPDRLNGGHLNVESGW